MNFRDYKWFRNPRGLHNFGVFRGTDINRWISTKTGWAKMVAGDTEYLHFLTTLQDHNSMGIVRIFRENMGAMRVPDDWYTRIYKPYIDNGIFWFELYNEPNLEGEWPQGSGGGPQVFVSYENIDGCIAPMMDNWIDWAEKLIAIGGYPAFPALSDSADHRHATVHWQDAFLKYLRDKHPQRMARVIASGLWAGTHPYIANHFYQEPPGGPSHKARPHYQEKWDEAGWHFEYPYDPLQQANDPGRTVFGGTQKTPYGDPNGLIAAGQAFQELLKKYFDAGPVPVIGTEGGIWKVPGVYDDPHVPDDRYPGYDQQSHAQANLAMFKWIAEKAPPWFWGLTLFGEHDYFEYQGIVPATQMMQNSSPILKPVANIDTGGGVFISPVPDLPSDGGDAGPQVGGTGPGPISGEADLHWLILAPGLQADWFFQAARRFWQTFRPTVLTNWALITRLPKEKSLAVTVLARPDTIGYMDEKVRDVWSQIYYDPVVYNSLSEMQAELDRRATAQRRFG
jgi:hypothetical protein